MKGLIASMSADDLALRNATALVHDSNRTFEVRAPAKDSNRTFEIRALTKDGQVSL